MDSVSRVYYLDVFGQPVRMRVAVRMTMVESIDEGGNQTSEAPRQHGERARSRSCKNAHNSARYN